MALVNQKIDHIALLTDWLEQPHKLGHILGYKKLTPLHGEWIKIFLKYKRFDLLQAHRGSYKTTCGVVAMVLLFLCFPDMRLLIVRKTGDLASDILKTIQKHFESNDVLRLYVFSRWGIVDVKTKIWSSERTQFAFKKTITPQPSIMAAGVGASIIGSHFDYIWSDDIETMEDRYSAAERRWTIAYFQELENLIDPLGQMRLSGTPWHELGVFSIVEEKYFEGRQFPFGTVDLPPDEMIEIAARKERLPNAEWCCNYELRHIQDNDTLGAFLTVASWDCMYCVAFVDPSFSDKTDTDSTAVSVVGVSRTGQILFTGMKLPKSISDEQTRIDILNFLQRFMPVESVIESQLAESSIFFINAFRETETLLNLSIKNLWTVKRQYRNKHERIAATVFANKPDMRMLEGTQGEYMLEVSRYYKGAPHDDGPDSLAGALEHLATSPIVAEYAAAVAVISR
jgi:hypothetical protein